MPVLRKIPKDIFAFDFHRSCFCFLGWYIYMEATGHYPGSLAIILTPLLPSYIQNMCLMFFYHMYGIHLGRLDVTVQFDNGTTLVLWTRGKFGSKY